MGMNQTSPRVPPIPADKLNDAQAKLIGAWSTLNFTRTIVRHPALYRVLIPLIEKVIPGSHLPPRDREILVLRALAVCDETYEAHHHIAIGQKAGLTDTEIAEAKKGGAKLAPFEQMLVRAAEELVRDHGLSDATWKALAERYDQVQLMEVPAVVGAFTLMAMLTKSLGIPLENTSVSETVLAELRQYS